MASVVVLLDISMPGPSGLDLIKQLRRERPALPLLVVSMHPAAQFARRALSAGADRVSDEGQRARGLRHGHRTRAAGTPVSRPRRDGGRTAALADQSTRGAASRLAFGSRVSVPSASRIGTDGVRYRPRARLERQDGSARIGHACYQVADDDQAPAIPQRLESQIDRAARAWGVHAHSKNQLRYEISRSSLQPIA